MIFNPNHIIIKIIAIAVCVCFLWQDVVWAAGSQERHASVDHLRTTQFTERGLEAGLKQPADAGATGWQGRLHRERILYLPIDPDYKQWRPQKAVPVKEYDYLVEVGPDIAVLFGKGCSAAESAQRKYEALIKFHRVPNLVAAMTGEEASHIFYGPMTEGILLAMQRIGVKDKNVVDFGSGIGTQVIAAAKLGAKKVIAVEQRQDLIGRAQINAQENGITEDQVEFISRDIIDLQTAHLGLDKVDIAIINLDRFGLDFIYLQRIISKFHPTHIIVSGDSIRSIESLQSVIKLWSLAVADIFALPYQEMETRDASTEPGILKPSVLYPTITLTTKADASAAGETIAIIAGTLTVISALGYLLIAAFSKKPLWPFRDLTKEQARLFWAKETIGRSYPSSGKFGKLGFEKIRAIEFLAGYPDKAAVEPLLRIASGDDLSVVQQKAHETLISLGLPIAESSVYCDYENDSIKQAAEEITFGLGNPKVKILAVSKWVQENIVFEFVDFEEPASATLASKRGTCYHATNLQIALLRALGFRTRFIIARFRNEVFKGLVPPSYYKTLGELSPHVYCEVLYFNDWYRFDVIQDRDLRPSSSKGHVSHEGAYPLDVESDRGLKRYDSLDEFIMRGSKRVMREKAPYLEEINNHIRAEYGELSVYDLFQRVAKEIEQQTSTASPDETGTGKTDTSSTDASAAGMASEAGGVARANGDMSDLLRKRVYHDGIEKEGSVIGFEDEGRIILIRFDGEDEPRKFLAEFAGPHLFVVHPDRTRTAITSQEPYRPAKRIIPPPTAEQSRRIDHMIARGLDYDEACHWREMKVEGHIRRLPNGFWNSEKTARNFILATLDTIPGFKEAREAGDIKTMAQLYREYVIGYKSPHAQKDGKEKTGGQQAFFHEVGGLAGFMAGVRDYFGNKRGNPGTLLRFVLPNLIDVRNPDALNPVEVENTYWDDPDNAKYHIFLVLDAIPGFKEAREANDIKTMAELYRTHVIGYKPNDTEKYKYGGQRSFFWEAGGLTQLMTYPRKYLDKTSSPAALLRFALPRLIDIENPDALDPLEVEHFYWEDPANARRHILAALDKIPGFETARKANDIKTMAELYRSYVIGYRSSVSGINGQVYFFYEIGHLRGLMMHPRYYFNSEKVNSPGLLLRFAVPGLIDDDNPDALHSDEVELKRSADGNAIGAQKSTMTGARDTAVAQAIETAEQREEQIIADAVGALIVNDEEARRYMALKPGIKTDIGAGATEEAGWCL